MTSSTSYKANPYPLHPAAPIPSVGERYDMLASSGSSGVGSGSLNASNLPNYSGSWLCTEAIDCVAWDTAMIEVHYDGHVSSSTGYPLIIPFGSNASQTTTYNQQSGPPPLTDGSWFALPSSDGSVMTLAESGSINVGSGSFNGNLLGVQKVYPLAIQVSAVSASNSKVRQAVALKVRQCRWLSFAIAERGDIANPGKIKLWIAGTI